MVWRSRGTCRTPCYRDAFPCLTVKDPKNGDFDVYLSVGEADGTPVYALPLADDDGERRYRLGKAKFR